MKKGVIVGKRQIVLAVLVFALGAAVWLNMKYASSSGGFDITGALNSSKNLGDAQYVNNPNTEGQTSSDENTASESEYFRNARQERENSRREAVELIQETISNVKADSQTKENALQKAADIALRIEKEASIESLLKAKGFEESLAIIGDNDVNVVVKGENLLSSQTLQIQDVVLSQVDVPLDNIKIVTVK